MHPVTDLSGTKEQKIALYQKALANFAIFKYLTQPSIWKQGDSLVLHKAYHYSCSDPMGTTDWTNTHVSHLLMQNEGNCFALAALFKIFSDRLQSDARLCTAPGHIYIRHANEKGIYYNVELSTRAFPGTGTIETLTHATTEAVKKNIALRELDNKQSVALCLVYLAKSYEYKFGVNDDDFMMACAEKALRYDDHNLNAMLLKAEVMEARITQLHKAVPLLKDNKDFKAYQAWVGHIFDMGYREMPFEMKNRLVQGWTKDTLIRLAYKDYRPEDGLKNTHLVPTRYASLSWGLFDEQIKTKPLERYGNTVFDTRRKEIVTFLNDDILYNQYNFDPVVFAWNIDPLAHEFPGQSPYSAFNNNPILYVDPDGRKWVNGFDANVAYWQGKLKEVPNDKSVQRALAYFEARQAAVKQVFKEMSTGDPALYNYIDNLKVMDYIGEMKDVEAIVTIDNRISGLDHGEAAVTEPFGPRTNKMQVDYNGKGIWLTVQDNTVQEGQERYGFNITLYGSDFYDLHLANEAGDIMYIMEYNEASEVEGGNKPRGDLYHKKGYSGSYSDRVETMYKSRKNDNTAKEFNPYPLKNEKK